MQRRIGFATRTLALFALIFPSSAAAQQQVRDVTLSRPTPVYRSMAATAAPVVTLPAGAVVTVMARYEEWSVVRYAVGREGFALNIDLYGVPAAGPCADPLYQALRAKSLEEMTEREFIYFTERDRACAEYQRTALSIEPQERMVEQMERASRRADDWIKAAIAISIISGVATYFMIVR